MFIKMKRKNTYLAVMLLAAGLSLIPFVLPAQTKSGKDGNSVKTAYLSEEELPDARKYLPAPARPSDPVFAGDLAFYNWGKSLRDTERGRKAHDDAENKFEYLCAQFSPAVGIELSYENTPAVCKLISRTMSTSSAATRNAKDFYKRTRPFDEFSERTGVPEMEESYHGSASYPSGHSTRGWTIALVLSELFPSHADEILTVGYQYGESRVIVGYHYESDVQAARVSSSAVMAVLHSNPEFCKDMKRAKREVRRLVK